MYMITGFFYVYKTIDKGENWSLIVTRTNLYQESMWFDRDNDRLYFAETDSATRATITAWYLDLADDSENNVGGNVSVQNDANVDIYIRDDNLEVIFLRTGDLKFIIMRWSGAAWNQIDASTHSGLSRVGHGVVVGTTVYFFYDAAGVQIKMMNFDGVTISDLDSTGAGWLIAALSSRYNMAYDGSDIFYTRFRQSGAPFENYSWSYSITDDLWVQGGIFDVAIGPNRCFDDTADPPFALELGFELSGKRIYQIPLNYIGNLNLISVFNFTNNVAVVSPHFVMDSGGKMYELVSFVTSISRFEIVHPARNIPTSEMLRIRDDFDITKGMFIQCIGNYTAHDSNRIFFGTYNFIDDTIGAAPAGWTGASAAVIYKYWQYHRKILQLTRSGSSPEISQEFGVDRESGTIEFYMGSDDVTHLTHFRLYHGGTLAIIISFKDEKITRYKAGYINVCDAVDDTLYRIRIDFECGDDAYLGLAADTYKIHVDGTEYGPYDFEVAIAHADKIQVVCNSVAVYKGYFDSFGYSWDTTYVIGDNRYVEEGEPDQIIFEGQIVDYDEQVMEKVWLESLARELLEIKPLSGEFRANYSGRTDEIIVDLISDYCGYVSSGTLTAGIAKGNVFFDGDTSLFTILNDFAKEDGFTWALTPIGELNYHLSVNSDVYLDETDKIWAVETNRPHRDINKVDVSGAFVNNEQIKGAWDDEASQLATGIQRFTYTDAKIRTTVLADALALQLGTNLAVNAKEVFLFHENSKIGLIQPAEELAIKYDTTNVNISKTQFMLNFMKFFVIKEYSDYSAADALLVAVEAFRNQTIDEQVEQNNALVQQNRESIGMKTGVSDVHLPGFTISFNDGDLKLTLTLTGTSFSYWIQGTRYTKLANDSVTITDTEGIWYIYYVADVLTASQVQWVIKDGNKCFIAIVYWDAANNAAISLMYECHGHDLPSATHSLHHRTIGTNFVEGLALVEGAGGNDGKIAMDGGELRDEDIHIVIVDGAGTDRFEQELGNTTVFAAAQVPVYYKSGATAWRKYTAGDYPFYDNSGGDNVHYNKYAAPNWSSQEATNAAKYVAMWIFGTSNIHEPVIAIMGQSESSTLNVAKEVNTLQGITWGTLPFEEMKILYRLIFKSDSSHAHTEDMRKVANVPGGTYVPQPTPSLASVVAVGNELTSGQVITSADEDLTFTFGRLGVGSPTSDYAYLAHKDHLSATNYMIHQNAAGSTFINAATGQGVYLRVNNANKVVLSATQINFSIPVVMGTNKITGLGNGVAAQDAMAFGQKYTNANAVAAVNAAGLSLATTKVIISPDEDLTFTFGRGAIGSPTADYACFSHRDKTAITQVALFQTQAGNTILNAPTGQLIYFRINNATKMQMSGTVLTMSVPIAMGANKITGLANAVDAQDALTKTVFDAHRHPDHTLQHDQVNSDSTFFIKTDGQTADYFSFLAAGGIPHFGGIGNANIYFRQTAIGTWNILHADDFTPHSAPLPVEASLDKILAIKNGEDGKLDLKSMPIDTYYSEKDGSNEGYKMNKMMLHLIKAYQEALLRIIELEK